MRNFHHVHSTSHVLRVGIVGLLLAGCDGNRIRGEIEDHQIKVRSAFFFAQPQAFESDGLIGIILTDRKHGCEDWTAYLTVSQGVVAPADQAANWAATFGTTPDFWEIAFLLRVANPAAPLQGALAGIGWDKPLDGANKATGLITHNLMVRDVAYYDGTGDISAYRDDYVTNGGTLELEIYQPGAAAKGRFATFTVDAANGDPTGLVDMYFNAEFCPGADLLDNAGQAAPDTTTTTGS